MLALAGCGKPPAEEAEQRLTLAEARTLQATPVAEVLSTEPYASADLALGEKLYAQCVVCHSLEPDAAAQIGPGLYGIFGRRVAADDNFAYSDALRGADFYWTPQAMDAWLHQPHKFVPGSVMPYAGLYDRGQRDALIAYLLSASE